VLWEFLALWKILEGDFGPLLLPESLRGVPVAFFTGGCVLLSHCCCLLVLSWMCVGGTPGVAEEAKQPSLQSKLEKADRSSEHVQCSQLTVCTPQQGMAHCLTV